MALPLPFDAAVAFRGDLRRSFGFSGVGTCPAFLPRPPLLRRDVCCVEMVTEPDAKAGRDRMPLAADTTLTFSLALVFCCFSGRRRARRGLTTEDGPSLNFSVLDIVGDVAESAIRLMLLVCADGRRFPAVVWLLSSDDSPLIVLIPLEETLPLLVTDT